MDIYTEVPSAASRTALKRLARPGPVVEGPDP